MRARHSIGNRRSLAMLHLRFLLPPASSPPDLLPRRRRLRRPEPKHDRHRGNGIAGDGGDDCRRGGTSAAGAGTSAVARAGRGTRSSSSAAAPARAGTTGGAGTVGSGGSAGNGTPAARHVGSGGAVGRGGTTRDGQRRLEDGVPGRDADPLPYTSGYTPDATIRDGDEHRDGDDRHREGAADDRPAPVRHANYNVFKQEDNTTRNIRGFLFRDGPRGVNLRQQRRQARLLDGVPGPDRARRRLRHRSGVPDRQGDRRRDGRSGNTMMLAPTMNILRHPAWGRAQETYGEDVVPARAPGHRVRRRRPGVRPRLRQALRRQQHRERPRDPNAQMDEQTLREIYARHFEMMIQDGGVASIMASYNHRSTARKCDAEQAPAERHAARRISASRASCCPTGGRCRTATASPAGSRDAAADGHPGHPGRPRYGAALAIQLLDADESWSTERIARRRRTSTTATARILEQKVRFNVDKTAGTLGSRRRSGYERTPSIANNDQTTGDRHEPRRPRPGGGRGVDGAAQERQQHAADQRATVQKIAVIGATCTYTVSRYSRTRDPAAATTARSIHDQRSHRRPRLEPRLPRSRPRAWARTTASRRRAGARRHGERLEPASAAAGADFVVVVAGLTPEDEGEEYTGAGDRTTAAPALARERQLGLEPKRNGGVQNGLIAAVAAQGKPMVVVLEGGSVIDKTPWLASVPAVVMAWYPGMVGGRRSASCCSAT